MIGLSRIAKELTAILSKRTGALVLAGRVENAVYPCCIAELSGETLVENQQLQRTVQVTLTLYPSEKRGREEGMALLDRMEQAVTEGFSLCGRQLCPKKVESLLTAKQLPQVRFALEFYDAPGEESAGEGDGQEYMDSLALTLETEKEE